MFEKLVFEDNGQENWKDKWVLDGLRSRVTNTPKGMIFEAGPYAQDHASMSVIWTKESFAGDFKLEFDYTRLDSINRFVNILYLQATGLGGDSPEDIHSWADQREIPYMKSYFQRMKLLHISFAAFGNDNDDPEDYIRARHYPVLTSETNEILNTVYNSKLFEPGTLRHITVTKTDSSLGFKVEGYGIETLDHSWNISALAKLAPGPIGIRHMCCRCSRYANLKVWQ